MAAENEVYIDTGLETNGIKKGVQNAKALLDNLGSKVEVLRRKMLNAFDMDGVKMTGRSTEEIKNDIASLEAELETTKTKVEALKEAGAEDTPLFQQEVEKLEDLKAKIQENRRELHVLGDDAYDAIGNVVEETQQASEETENVGEKAQKSSKQLNKMGTSAKNAGSKTKTSFKGGIKSIAKFAIGVLALKSLFDRVTRAATEGFKNLAQFNGGNNDTNKALSNLMSELELLKNSLSAAFAPILTVVEPLLSRLMSMLSAASNAIAGFMAALTGQGTYTKAIKNQKNYAKSLKDTSSAADGQLASFDKLNNTNDSSSGGGSSDPNKMFQTVTVTSGMKNLANKVKGIIEPFKVSIANWFNGLNFQPLLESLGKLKTAIEPLIGMMAQGLLWLLENVLEPIGTFTIEESLPTFFDTLSSAAEYLTTALTALQPTFDYIWNEILQPLGEWSGDIAIDAMNTLGETFDDLASIFDEKSEKINHILRYLSIGVKVMVDTFKRQFNALWAITKVVLSGITTLVSDLIDVFDGIIEFLEGTFTGDWEKAWNGLRNMLGGIFNSLITVFETIVNSIVEAINALLPEKIPDWVPLVGGQETIHLERLDLSSFRIPMLAQGTVVPRQASQFAAILGDNNRETEVVSPLSTMKQAFKEALAEYGSGSNQPVEINLLLDGRVVTSAVVERDRQNRIRTGRSLFDPA